ncbi:MAG: DUF559 domain-containing protein [Fimbriimonadaceae bacterium]|nr:DUF559 domain-containing protein [Fimbriimonadaceae bacterium]
MRQNSKNHTVKARKNARRLRAEMGVSERVLWNLLRRDQTGFHWRRQVPIGPFVLDFYCSEASLAVEIDGEQHALRIDKDAARDAFFMEKGIQTVRFASLTLFDIDTAGLERILRDITAICEERSGRKATDVNPRRKRFQDSDR